MAEAAHAARRRGTGEHRRRFRFVLRRARPRWTMRPVGEMHDDVGAGEMFGPARPRRDLADRAALDAGDWLRRAARQAEDPMAALNEPGAQRPADEAGGTRHHNPRHLRLLQICASDLTVNALERRRSRSKADPTPVAHPDPIRSTVPPMPPPAAAAPRRPKLLFLVTEDWYFCSHRLPVARAARDAGFEVVVATRVHEHGGQICDEGFGLRSIPWRRRGDGLLGAARAIAAIARLYRAERPDILHHVALKPVLFGSIARHLAFARSRHAPTTVDSVVGLGSGFTATTAAARLRRPPLGLALRLAMGGGRDWVVVQNPEDRAALVALGIAPTRIALIR